MNIISKFSLYDIIAMVIPGFTILLFITSLMGYKWTVNEMNVDSTVFWRQQQHYLIVLVLSMKSYQGSYGQD